MKVDTVRNAEEITVFWWTPGLEIFKIHMWLSLRQVSLYFSKYVVFRFLTKAADLLSTAGLRGGASWIWLDFHIQHKLDALERWESWRPSQHLELFILFFKLSWRDSAVTGCIHPSASGYYHLRVQLPWRGVRDLRLLVRARVISTWAQGAKFSLENITLPPKDLPCFHCARCCDFFPK